MDFDWLPKELVTLCNAVVKRRHKAYGGSLPKLLWHRDTTVFIMVHGDLRTMLGAANAAWKFSMAAGVAAVLLVVSGALLNWWIALAGIPAVAVMLYFKKRETDFYMLLAAIILAMEMLAEDVGGCGARYPTAVFEARKSLEEYFPNDRTHLLDFYLPGRSELPRDLLDAIGGNP